MKENVHDQMASERPSLVAYLCRNTDLSGTVMAYLNLLCGMCWQLGYPMDGIEVDPLVESHGGAFKAKVHFHRIATAMPKMWGTTSDFEAYAAAKARHLANALRVNPKLESWFLKMAETLDRYCIIRGFNVEDIAIEDPIITKGSYILTFKVKRKLAVA